MVPYGNVHPVIHGAINLPWAQRSKLNGDRPTLRAGGADWEEKIHHTALHTRWVNYVDCFRDDRLLSRIDNPV